VQPQYNLLNRTIERELLPFCRRFGIGIIPYSPLAGGLLTGKYRLGEPPPPGTRAYNNPNMQRQLTEQNLRIVERLSAFAQARGHTVGELALAWLAAHPEVSTIIAGATSPEQVEQNVKAADWKLTGDELKEIEALLAG
jgi:aryl-alcohol dehydrogenase-like predicted oxidoreductase